MPPRRSNPRRRPPAAPGYQQLERHMSLLAWLHHLLGYGSTTELLADLKPSAEGFTPEGPSHIYRRLSTRARHFQGLTTDRLAEYDANIKAHLAAMNAGRPDPITLRYFQYLAALYTEIFLDHYCRNPSHLLRLLNDFVQEHNINCRPDARYAEYWQPDLQKLALWMATGSGKTLLLHLNYRQFLHYNRKYGRPPPDNILLITPNAGLSQQHIAEMQASNIPASRFNPDAAGGMFAGGAGTVQVTEITKLVDEKPRGGGVRVPVETFEGNNLIFVDEGHKGSGGAAWRSLRDALGETGFTFEYSATFGQALAAAHNKDALLAEYGKAIAFDYSYRHFYHDGYGKDFRILNLQQESAAADTDLLLLTNLMSFYEQQRVFDQAGDDLRPYNLERPLWVFVGSVVNRPENAADKSDILTVVRFLHRALSAPEWACNGIQRILDGASGLTDAAGRDLFADRFDYLRASRQNASAIYADILQSVMHAAAAGRLCLSRLPGNDAELGLKAAGSDHYFGVIYIGDTASFRQLVEQQDAGIAIEDDAFTDSLFDRINETGDDTRPVQILIGAKKFMEGWNSWRVSSMGLLNIGRNEGSQIIQLFGRGVRLRGREMSLQRSAALPPPHPRHLRLLETLNIFAVRADYMAQFHQYLASEGVAIGDTLQLSLPIRPNRDFLNRGLVIPRLPAHLEFAGAATVMLEPLDGMRPVELNLSAAVQQVASAGGDLPQSFSAGVIQEIPPASTALVDWDAAYTTLLAYRNDRQYANLVIQIDGLRRIIDAGPAAYRLTAAAGISSPRNPAARQRLQQAVESILRRYADALYRQRQRQWESQNFVYQTLDEHDSNLNFNIGDAAAAGRYIVHIPRNNATLIADIEQLIADCNTLHSAENDRLPRIHFDRHLYQPLLVNNHDTTSVPAGLAASERKFVADLRDFWTNHRDELPAGTELFLLRNLSRGRGVGFFANEGFFPDFILWIKRNHAQRIVFVEPHGMRHASAYPNDDKARLHEKLPALAAAITQRTGITDVQLDSFIVSTTGYQELRPNYDSGNWDLARFTSAHILFQENRDYIAAILKNGSPSQASPPCQAT